MIRATAGAAKVSVLLAKRAYSINIAASGTNVVLPDPTTDVSVAEPQLLAQALYLYKKYFPNETSSKIEKYEELTRNPRNVIKVGLLYDDFETARHSKVLEAILADPLALGNDSWFYPKVVERNRDDDNVYRHKENLKDETEIDRSEEVKHRVFGIPSPMLSAIHRPMFSKSFSRVIVPAEKNDIEITEINTSSSTATSDKNETLNLSEFHVCINVTSSIGRAVAFQTSHPETLNQIVVTVIDNCDFTPSSTEDSPVTAEAGRIFKIDSLRYYEGVSQFLKHDVKAGTQYIDGLINSNILELQKALGWYLSTPILQQLLLESIYHECKAQEMNVNVLNEEYAKIKQDDISHFSESVHSELQFHFIPETDKFFRNTFTWWKLYLKNDNVEYDLKDYFNKHFMNSSIENYNFVRGKIVERLTRESPAISGTGEIERNALLELKSKVINEKISTEVQPVVFSAITESFLLYQLPITIIAAVSYQYFEFSANLAFALFSLGIVVGVNHLSKKWTTFSSKWRKDLYEEIRMTLGRRCIEEGLVKELEDRYQEQKCQTKIREGVLKVLKEQF